MNSKFNLTFGADPEFFVKEKKTDKAVPACRLFGGEKGSPVFLSPDGGYLEDGTTVEFNVSPCSSLKAVRNKLNNLILIFLNKYDRYQLLPNSSVAFSKAALDEFPEACQIGCSPDLFAYGLRTSPSIAKFGTTRFAGGHVHIGIDPWPDGLEKAVLVRFVDLLFGLAFVNNADKERWRFYGHPGLYRETNYGIEHRSPDNYWCNPAAYTGVSTNRREVLQYIIDTFDTAFCDINNILDFDGHGARLNRTLDAFIKETNVEIKMNNPLTLSDPAHMYGSSGLSSECARLVSDWATEIARIRRNRLHLGRERRNEAKGG